MRSRPPTGSASPPASGCGESRCRWPCRLIVAGVRLAAVSTIGLVTVTAIMGDAYGGLGFFILEGYRHSFPLELYVGAIPSILLAFVVDAALVRYRAG